MSANRLDSYGTVRTPIEYWPSFVDILIAILMVFVLQNFIQSALNVDTLEAARIGREQSALRTALGKTFPRELAARAMSLETSPNLLQIRFSDRILFPPGSHLLQDDGKSILRRLTHVLTRADVARYEQIQVEGHTDNSTFARPDYPRDNWELSTSRALSVVSFLLHDGINPAKLSANGHGEHDPIASNNSAEGRGLNRRIELRIVFSAPKQTRSSAR
ncbi:MAG: Flagellar motor rotation protein MotB [Gemmatimonadetes bacterium]|nr:Flagellar motor rotation protein MotB [Gemmatimonadota bacterium]